ncbi:MAG: putative manganese transporter [Lachnospiraceae bacterium]|nr:putative manganese transporter [Lachnospiraceae bacterium]
MLLETILDAVLDCVKMLPFLFVAFLLLEALEHHSLDKINQTLVKAEKLGPLVGALVGCIPQCGFSILASNFYAGGVVSLGTLMAVYLATSDEALIIMMSGAAPAGVVLKMIICKIVIGAVAGYLIMLIMKTFRIHRHLHDIEELCRDEDCGCHEDNAGLLKPALHHTFKIFIFIFVFTLILNLVLHFVGIENVSRILLTDTVFQPILAALIGLIPNCASSVVLVQLYMEGVMSFGSVLAGLCSSAGLGIVVLAKVNRDKKESAFIIGLLLVIAIICGIIGQIIF